MSQFNITLQNECFRGFTGISLFVHPSICPSVYLLVTILWSHKFILLFANSSSLDMSKICHHVKRVNTCLTVLDVFRFFLMHLINKPDTEYTGQETYVWELYQQRCWDFFPVGDCFRKQYEDEITGSQKS